MPKVLCAVFAVCCAAIMVKEAKMTSRVKKPVVPRKKANGYNMPAPISDGEILHDTIMKKKWRIGPSIGVGGFGEIYSACDHESSLKKGSCYPFVVKIEPHENGPLFVEKNFYVRNANKDDITKYMKEKKLPSLGMPTYFGNGSHEYKGVKYRYLVLERYGKDLGHLLQENGRTFPPATVFQIGLQMLEVLEYIHSRGYVHADIKGGNILLGLKKGTENQCYLVDFGLATRMNSKEFKPDPKCAHNGTIEYTSRDAHLGVATQRGDLEILGYNMLHWLAGELPWEKSLKSPKEVQSQKEAFMKAVRSTITKQYKNVPEALIIFFEYINTLKPKDNPDFMKCSTLFENFLKSEGKTRRSKLEFAHSKKAKSNTLDEDTEDEKTPRKKSAKSSDGKAKPKRAKKVKEPSPESEDENCENEEPDSSSDKKIVKRRNNKRTSTEPALVVKVKKPKLTPKPTPPLKKNHASTATQTSTERPRRSPRQVSFDSPIAAIIGNGNKPLKLTKDNSANSSGDIFEDSFVIEEKKIKPKRKLLSSEEVTVKKVVKKKVTSVKTKATTSWKDAPTVVNGRSPPK